MNFNETALEQTIIEILKHNGYDYFPGEEIERDYHEVILTPNLKQALAKLNPSATENLIIEAIRIIKNLDQNNVVKNNQEFTRMLHAGVSVPTYGEHGVEYHTINLID